MKKIIVFIFVAFLIFSCGVVFANNVGEEGATTGLIQMKEKELATLDDYKQAYDSQTYGLTAYILRKIQVFSIPFCFIGIVISAIYQYILGIKKLDVRDKGFAIMLSIITVFVICQVLPLIFAIVVKGWRG